MGGPARCRTRRRISGLPRFRSRTPRSASSTPCLSQFLSVLWRRKNGNGTGSELGLHHESPGSLAGFAETVVLVEVEGWVVGLDGQADCSKPVLSRLVEQRGEQFLAEPLPAPARDDRNRQLGGLRIDEAVPGVTLAEQAIPGRADGLKLIDRDERGVTPAAPTGHIALQRDVCFVAPARVVRVPQHVAEERQVLRPGRPDHAISSVSWIRFPSGSKTSTMR